MVQVKVSEGVLEGEILEGSLGGSYYSFKGIPYAQPPIGDLRFKAPQPPIAWNGIRSARKHGPVCYQFDVFSGTIVKGSEDCLYLNVYTPNIKPAQPLAVMVWIHGGSYMSGSGNSSFYGPDFLIERNIILVTFNYRLEILGFLCLDSEDIPGNAGMKDQVAALKWVKENIRNFGGDPNNVTLFGESAGGGAVSYHTISPMSKGLFKRAIIQSAACNCQWTRSFEPRQRAIALAHHLGKQSENNKELYEFFKNLPVEFLVRRKAPITMSEELQSKINVQFTIVDEKLFGDNERFFYGDMFDQLRNGIHDGVDVLTGYTADEGYLIFAKSPLEDIISNFNTYLESFVPMSLTFNCPLTDQLEIGRKLKQYYYGENRITKENLEPLIRFFSFATFIVEIMQWVKFCAKRKSNKVFLYKFSCLSERNVLSRILGIKKRLIDRPIVSHADDLMYLFDIKVANLALDKTSKSYKMINNVTTLWTNFAKYGNPTPDGVPVEWTPYSLEKEDYLDIGEDLISSQFPEKQELKFWESIIERYFPQSIAISTQMLSKL